jgi:hypothetical protein
MQAKHNYKTGTTPAVSNDFIEVEEWNDAQLNKSNNTNTNNFH